MGIRESTSLTSSATCERCCAGCSASARCCGRNALGGMAVDESELEQFLEGVVPDLDGKPLRATVEVEVIEVIASSKAERATHGKWRTLGESWTQRFELDFRRDDQAIEELVSARELAALVEYDGATKTWSVKPNSTVEVGNATLAVVGTDMTDGGHGKNDSGQGYDTFSLIAVPTKVGTPPTAVVTSAGLETLLVGVPVKLPVLVQRPPEPDATTAPAE